MLNAAVTYHSTDSALICFTDAAGQANSHVVLLGNGSLDGIARIPLIDYSVVDGVERDGCAPGEAEFIPKTVQYIAIINGGVQSNNTKGRQNPYVEQQLRL